jgi:hypothetical protein
MNNLLNIIKTLHPKVDVLSKLSVQVIWLQIPEGLVLQPLALISMNLKNM